MAKKWRNQDTTDLLKCILVLKNINEAEKFFRDLLTTEEIIEFGKRWKVARLLDQGTPYSTIEKNTGLSSATIARVSKWLSNGMGGYKLMLAKTNKEHHSLSAFKKG